MFHMSEQEFRNKMRKVRLKNESKMRKIELRNAKKKYNRKGSISTTKLIAVYLFVLLNMVLGFAMYMMYRLSDLTYLGVLITDIVAQVITYLIYVVKSTKENTSGGIKYETAIRSLEMNTFSYNNENNEPKG